MQGVNFEKLLIAKISNFYLLLVMLVFNSVLDSSKLTNIFHLK